jgi:glycosyltransferase involved in cell wall biosynthesis
VKIVHIDNADNGGGASRSAYRLHDGLRRLGENSAMYVLNKRTKDPFVKRFQSSPGKVRWISRNMRRLRLNLSMLRYERSAPEDQTFFSEDRTPFYLDSCRQIPESDVINLHWIANFLDLEAFFLWLPKNMPLVWTLHDMAAFTGGCCHAMGCAKFTEQCGACPQLGSSNEHDLSRDVWLRKQGYYSSLGRERIHLVTPSQWLGKNLNRSSLLSRFPHSVIPYGLDLEVFQPRDRALSRELLGIAKEAKVVLFVSNGLVHLKGFHILLDALSGIDGSSELHLLSLGLGASPALDRFKHTHIPSIAEDGLLSLIYSAADVFVLPSLADNLPNTMLESIACGTPVVASAVGGIPDTVRPGVTGVLVKPGDAAELRAALLGLLGNDSLRAEMSSNCRKIALAEYSLELQARRYLEIYETMLAATKLTRAS